MKAVIDRLCRVFEWIAFIYITVSLVIVSNAYLTLDDYGLDVLGKAITLHILLPYLFLQIITYILSGKARFLPWG